MWRIEKNFSKGLLHTLFAYHFAFPMDSYNVEKNKK